MNGLDRFYTHFVLYGLNIQGDNNLVVIRVRGVGINDYKD
jgi:hypothetical protein